MQETCHREAVPAYAGARKAIFRNRKAEGKRNPASKSQGTHFNIPGGRIMSKYQALWESIQKSGLPSMKLSFDEIHEIAGFEIDHSFLNYKKELQAYGYQVGKISLKEKTVTFTKMG